MLRKTLDNLPIAKPYLIVSLLALVLFAPTWWRLAGQWMDFEQVLAHGLATFLIYLGLLLIHPPGGKYPVSFKPSLLGGGVLLVTTLGWAVLELVRIDTLAFLALPAGVAAMAWTLLGFRAMVTMLPYIFLLGISLPFWADLVPFLVHLASIVVGEWVRWFGMTALIEGSSITLPYGRLIIADGCSGIGYFAISILVAAMTAILNDYRWKGWLALLAGGIAIALVVNWVRIAALVVIAYQTDMQSGIIEEHEMFGWLIYAGFMLPAMLLVPVRRRSGAIAEAPPIGFSRSATTAVVVAFLAGPVAIQLAHVAAGDTPRWQPTGLNLLPGKIENLPIALRLPETLHHESWKAVGSPAWVSVAQFQKQTASDKLVPYLPARFDRDDWYLEEAHHNGQVNVYRHINSRKRVALADWYQVGDYRTTSYAQAKLLQIPATLSGQTRFALVTVLAACTPRSCDLAVNSVANAANSLVVAAPME